MMHEVSNRRRRAQKGQALIEGAFVTLAIVLMVTFVLDMGQMLMFMQYFTDRARVGARHSSVSSFDETRIQNKIVYGDAQNSARESDSSVDTPGILGLKPSNVVVQRHDAGTPFDRVEVRIENFPLRFFTPFLAGEFRHRPFRAVMPVESMGATE